MDYDMTSLIKKYNFDTGKLNKSAMNKILDRGAGAINSLPLEITDYVLYYKKNYFDERGEPYPTAGMTYDEAYEKTIRMTYQRGYTQIKGWSQHPDRYVKLNQLGLSFFSQTECDKVEINTPEWLALVENMARFYKISSNVWKDTTDFSMLNTASMCVDTIEKSYYFGLIEGLIPTEDYEEWKGYYEGDSDTWKIPQLEDWNMVPVPVFPEAPNNIIISTMQMH